MISARILERRKDYTEIENYEKAIADTTRAYTTLADVWFYLGKILRCR